MPPLYLPDSIVPWNPRMLPADFFIEDFDADLTRVLANGWVPMGNAVLPKIAVNPYAGVNGAVDAMESGTYRPSWLMMQPINAGGPMGIAKPLGVLPANLWMSAAMTANFRLIGSATSDDCSISINLCADLAGAPDINNCLTIWVVEVDAATTNVESYRTVAGVPTNVETSGNFIGGSQGIYFAAFQKIAGLYHFWTFNAAGQWLWMGSYTPGFTPAWVAILGRNRSIASPGSMVMGCDWVRGYSGIMKL